MQDSSVLHLIMYCAMRVYWTNFLRCSKCRDISLVKTQESESFGHVVSDVVSVLQLISDPKRGGKLLMGGDINISQRFVSPTVILNPSGE